MINSGSCSEKNEALIELKKSEKYPLMPIFFRAASKRAAELPELDGIPYAYFILVFNAEYRPGTPIANADTTKKFPHNKFILLRVEPGEPDVDIEDAEFLFDCVVTQNCHLFCPEVSTEMSHSPRYVFEKMRESIHKHVTSIPSSLSQHQGHLKLEETIIYFKDLLQVPRSQVEKALSLGIYEGQIVSFGKDRIQFVVALLERAKNSHFSRPD